MKTMLKMICLLTIMFVGAQVKAQDKEQLPIYGYAYSVNSKSKIMYVSNIVSGYLNHETYAPPGKADVTNQWRDKMSAEVEKADTYSMDASSFYESENDREEISEERTKLIGTWKQRGYEIRYINTFRLVQRKWYNKQ